MNNIQKLQEKIKENNLDAIMLTGEISRLYATGFQSTDGLLFVTAQSADFFTDSRYIEAAEASIHFADVHMVSGTMTYADGVNQLISKFNVKTLGFEEAYMTVIEYLKWKDRLVNIDFVPAQGLITSLRESKSREELEKLIAAQRTAEKSFNEILPLISTKITEKELAAELLYRFMRNGAQGASFDSIVVSGAHTSMPHGVPTDNKITKGFLTIDFGVKLNGWCSDTTRTLCIGKPSEEMVKVYQTVLNAQLAGIEKARACITGKEIDAAAREYIHKAGYGGYFGHGFGHGLGLEIHESPTVSPSGNRLIPEGALISAEPGIYIPGKFGVRIEDVLYLTTEGSENITILPKELIIL